MKRAFYWMLIILFAGAFVFAGYKLLSTEMEYAKGRKLYEDTAVEYSHKAIVIPAGDEDYVWDEMNFEQFGTLEDHMIYPPFTVDFAGLQAVNPDVIGWIYCPGTIIDYPIMQGSDNSYYLKHLMDGTYNFDGSIFVDYENDGFNDTNTIVYGHNMKDGQMFAELTKYESQDFYDQHPYMWIFTPERNYLFVPLSGHRSNASGGAYKVFKENDDELKEYLSEMMELSDFTPYPIVTEKLEINLRKSYAKFAVLSTCEYSQQNSRYTLHGYLMPVASTTKADK